MASAEQIDDAILSVVSDRWTKGAMVAAQVRRDLKEIHDADIQSRLQLLVDGGTLEVSGDISALGSCKLRVSRAEEAHDPREIGIGFVMAAVSIVTACLALKGETLIWIKYYGAFVLTGDRALAARVGYSMCAVGYALIAGVMFGKLPRRNVLVKCGALMAVVGTVVIGWLSIAARRDGL